MVACLLRTISTLYLGGNVFLCFSKIFSYCFYCWLGVWFKLDFISARTLSVVFCKTLLKAMLQRLLVFVSAYFLQIITQDYLKITFQLERFGSLPASQCGARLYQISWEISVSTFLKISTYLIKFLFLCETDLLLF